jgi:hypothetical protein
MEVCGQQADRFRVRRSGSALVRIRDTICPDAPRLQRNLGADIALRKEHNKEWPKMKLCFGSVIAAALWANIAQTQALPNGSGPGSSMPVSPDDGPLLSQPGNYPLSATGVTAGTPGPYLPNPNDSTRLSLTYSGGFPSQLAGE